MISIKKVEDFGKTSNGTYLHCVEGVCLSTDIKPTDWANGSILIEMDTKKICIYDAENEVWREL